MFYIKNLHLLFVHGQKTAGSSIATCISNLEKKDVICTPFGKLGSKFYFGSGYVKFNINGRHIIFYLLLFFADVIAHFFPRLRKKRSNGFGGFFSFVDLTSLHRHSSYIDWRKWAGKTDLEVKKILFVHRDFDELFSSYVQYIYKDNGINSMELKELADNFIFSQKQMMTWPDNVSVYVLRFDSISQSYANFARFVNLTHGARLTESIPHLNINAKKRKKIIDFDGETKHKIRDAGEWAKRVLESHPNVVWF